MYDRFEDWDEEQKEEVALSYPEVNLETDKGLLELYRIAASENHEDHDAMVFAAKTEYDRTDQNACRRVVERLIWMSGAKLDGSSYTEEDFTKCVIPFQSLKEYKAYAGDNPNENIIASIKAREQKEMWMPERPTSWYRKRPWFDESVYNDLVRIRHEKLVYVPETKIGDYVVNVVKKQLEHEKYPYVKKSDLKKDLNRRLRTPLLGNPLMNFLMFLIGLFIFGLIASAIYS